MIFWFLIGALAALGLLCVCWCVVCMFCGQENNHVLLYFCQGKAPFAAIARFRALRALGLIHGLLLLVDSDLSSKEQLLLSRTYSFIRFCSTSDLLEVLTEEDSLFD